MAHRIKNYNFIEKFECLGADCEDTCCKGWGMQLDSVRKELYEKEAPELLDAVTSGEAELIMKRDPKTDYCVKFDNGICSIHKEKGTKFLGDACHFYPRVTRKFGSKITMSAALSCPEITRLALFEDNAFATNETEIERIPVEIKNYLPDGVTEEDAEKIINAFIELAGDKSSTPERIMARIISVANSLTRYETGKWGEGINLMIKMSGEMLPAPEENPLDCHYLLNTLAGLIYASKKTSRPRLEEVFKSMESAMGIEINKETLEVMQNVGQENFPKELKEKWQRKARENMSAILKRWIQTQLAMASFPFSGFGDNVAEKVVILGVRFATVKLALMSNMKENGDAPDKETIVKIIQSIARFVDHLADPELSMNMYKEAGWTREARLRSLVGDI